MGDSSYFQNTSIYQNWVFAYRVFDWLNHTNNGVARKNILLIVMFILMGIILGFLGYRRAFPTFLGTVLIIFLILSIWLGGLYNLKRFPRPAEIVPQSLLLN